MVLLTPITFGGYSSEIKKAMDRSICLVLPFFRRVEWRSAPPPTVPAVPGARGRRESWGRRTRSRSGSSGTLVERNARNMDSPAALRCASCRQGLRRWSYARPQLEADLEPVLARVAGRVA